MTNTESVLFDCYKIERDFPYWTRLKAVTGEIHQKSWSDRPFSMKASQQRPDLICFYCLIKINLVCLVLKMERWKEQWGIFKHLVLSHYWQSSVQSEGECLARQPCDSINKSMPSWGTKINKCIKSKVIRCALSCWTDEQDNRMMRWLFDAISNMLKIIHTRKEWHLLLHPCTMLCSLILTC